MSTLQAIADAILLEKETKIIPENIKQGVTIFDVEGSLSEQASQPVSGDVKLFTSEEEMHASMENNLNDLAVIYAPKIQNFTVGMEASILNFPQTVVLPEAQTTSQSIRFRTIDTSAYVDVSGGLTPEYFYLSVYGDSSSFNIEFASTDGITYTRTDSSDSVQDLGTLVTPYESYWSDAAGYFIQVDSTYFGGLFQYSNVTNNDIILMSGTQSERDAENKIIPQYIDKILYTEDIIPGILKAREFLGDYFNKCHVTISNDFKYLYFWFDYRNDTIYTNQTVTVYNNQLYIRAYQPTGNTYYTFRCLKYDIETNLITERTDLQPVSLLTSGSSYYYHYSIEDQLYAGRLSYSSNDELPISWNAITLAYHASNTSVTTSSVSIQPNLYYYNTYINAPSQLSLATEDQLLPGIIGYGKTGIVTGTNDIYNNLNIDTMTSKVLPDFIQTFDEENFNHYANLLSWRKNNTSSSSNLQSGIVNKLIQTSNIPTWLLEPYKPISSNPTAVDLSWGSYTTTRCQITDDAIWGICASKLTQTASGLLVKLDRITGEIQSWDITYPTTKNQYPKGLHIEGDSVYIITGASFGYNGLSLYKYDIATNQMTLIKAVNSNSYSYSYCGWDSLNSRFVMLYQNTIIYVGLDGSSSTYSLSGATVNQTYETQNYIVVCKQASSASESKTVYYFTKATGTWTKITVPNAFGGSYYYCSALGVAEYDGDLYVQYQYNIGQSYKVSGASLTLSDKPTDANYRANTEQTVNNLIPLYEDENVIYYDCAIYIKSTNERYVINQNTLADSSTRHIMTAPLKDGRWVTVRCTREESVSVRHAFLTETDSLSSYTEGALVRLTSQNYSTVSLLNGDTVSCMK